MALGMKKITSMRNNLRGNDSEPRQLGSQIVGINENERWGYK